MYTCLMRYRVGLSGSSIYTSCRSDHETHRVLLPAAKARVALFYMSGVSFVAGVSAILVGMACKLGRLHSHFRKSESYKVLQGEKAR